MATPVQGFTGPGNIEAGAPGGGGLCERHLRREPTAAWLINSTIVSVSTLAGAAFVRHCGAELCTCVAENRRLVVEVEEKTLEGTQTQPPFVSRGGTCSLHSFLKGNCQAHQLSLCPHL